MVPCLGSLTSTPPKHHTWVLCTDNRNWIFNKKTQSSRSPNMSCSPAINRPSLQLHGVDDISVDAYLRLLEDRVRNIDKASLQIKVTLFEGEVCRNAEDDKDYELKVAVLETVKYFLSASAVKTGSNKKKRKRSGDDGRHIRKCRRLHCDRLQSNRETSTTPARDAWHLERKDREEKQKQQREQRQQKRLSRL